MSISLMDVYSGYSKTVDILHGISLDVKEGLITLVIGPNGAGKSTLLKTIFGFIRPRLGRINYAGMDITNKRPSEMIRLGIGYVAQEREIFPYLSVEENLELGGWIIRYDKRRVRSTIEDIYEKYPTLRDRRLVKAALLSGGEQRMLEIAKVLMTRPKVVLMDEPTAGLSPKIAKEIYGEIVRLKEEGMTILLVDQNVRAALDIADYVYVIEDGKVASSGGRQEFKDKLSELIKGWLLPRPR